MNSWIVETLTLVKRYAAESGLENLTDEMDIALLIAAEEIERRSDAAKGRMDVVETGEHFREVVVYPRPFRARRYH
ncbi:MAG: hypothetical protein AAFN79_16925 [Pseudomonadota bacterium]